MELMGVKVEVGVGVGVEVGVEVEVEVEGEVEVEVEVCGDNSLLRRVGLRTHDNDQMNITYRQKWSCRVSIPVPHRCSSFLTMRGADSNNPYAST
jgi:hypothetical protein